MYNIVGIKKYLVKVYFSQASVYTLLVKNFL